jgi:hypothetical protein
MPNLAAKYAKDAAKRGMTSAKKPKKKSANKFPPKPTAPKTPPPSVPPMAP